MVEVKTFLPKQPKNRDCVPGKKKWLSQNVFPCIVDYSIVMEKLGISLFFSLWKESIETTAKTNHNT